MIKSSHPEFEKLISGHSVPAGAELVEFLDALGVAYSKIGAFLTIDSSLVLLDERAICAEMRQLVPASQMDLLDIEIHRVTTSTNDVVVQRLSSGHSTSILCAAEMQTAGKGRRGRSWVSPFGRNIYLTYGCVVQCRASELSGLSLVIGMTVVDVLRAVGIEQVGLKWPNDILLEGGKLGGILVDLSSSPNGVGVVVGLGLNLSLTLTDKDLIDQPCTVAGSDIGVSRNVLLGKLCGEILNVIRKFENTGFKVFCERWTSYNLHHGHRVNVIRGEEISSGLDCGVDIEGNLLLLTDSGMEVYGSGEVSVRLAADR